MAQSTDEVAYAILAAVSAEQNHKASDMRLRKPLGVLTKDLMRQHDWTELDFLQGWGLIQSEKLAEVQQYEGAYYPCVTEAGREYLVEQQDKISRAFNRGPLLSGNQMALIIRFLAIAGILAYMVWKANH